MKPFTSPDGRIGVGVYEPAMDAAIKAADEAMMLGVEPQPPIVARAAVTAYLFALPADNPEAEDGSGAETVNAPLSVGGIVHGPEAVKALIAELRELATAPYHFNGGGDRFNPLFRRTADALERTATALADAQRRLGASAELPAKWRADRWGIEDAARVAIRRNALAFAADDLERALETQQ